MVEKSSQAVSQASDGAGKISGKITAGLSGLSGPGPRAYFAVQAKGALGQLSKLGGGLADGALAAAQKALSTVRGISLSGGQGGVVGDVGVGTAAAAAAVVVAAGAAAVGRGGGGTAGDKEGAEVASAGGNTGERPAAGEEEGRLLQPIGGSAGGEGSVTEGEGQLLQPVGVKLETGAANEGEMWWDHGFDRKVIGWFVGWSENALRRY